MSAHRLTVDSETFHILDNSLVEKSLSNSPPTKHADVLTGYIVSLDADLVNCILEMPPKSPIWAICACEVSESSARGTCSTAGLTRSGVIRSIDAFGPLAQLVEQLTLNQRVVGSIPTRLIRNRRMAVTPAVTVFALRQKPAGFAGSLHSLPP